MQNLVWLLRPMLIGNWWHTAYDFVDLECPRRADRLCNRGDALRVVDAENCTHELRQLFLDNICYAMPLEQRNREWTTLTTLLLPKTTSSLAEMFTSKATT